MSKKKVSYKSELPKIKNIFSYSYYCISKVFALIYFGIGAVFLGIFVFPFIRLFSLGHKDFGIIAFPSVMAPIGKQKEKQNRSNTPAYP